jgi:hypothetical protein
MRYFNSLPKVLTTDYKNNAIVLTNLLARSEIVPSLLKNPLLFYSYDVQEGDTPEIVADKYYGDSYKFWIVLFSNQILDPQFEWPLSSQQFLRYIADKYSVAANSTNQQVIVSYTLGTVKEYRKTITTTDSISLQTTSKTYVIDELSYNRLVPSTTSAVFPSGATVTESITKDAISIYTYETELNESKRTINLINSMYAGQIETQLDLLMRA